MFGERVDLAILSGPLALHGVSSWHRHCSIPQAAFKVAFGDTLPPALF